MKQIEIKKIVVFLLISILCVQIIGCCKKKHQIKKVENKTDTTQGKKEPKNLSVPDESSKLLDKTGLNFSIDRRQSSAAPVKNRNSFFERQYIDGVNSLEAGEFDKALKSFNDILSQYPNGEEASIAALCIAEVYFRSKNNEAALKLYKEIVQKYPGTQAAQNAAEGIEYLEGFSKHESTFVPPEIEDRKRRGR
jgi:TolA-binding protein